MFELFTRVKSSKKGSLELSVNAIIIVVLAMTLLGLGLGFIRNMFQNIGGTTTEVQEQVREQITAQLRTSGEKISFPRSIQFGRGEAKVITLGVQNTGTQTLYFKMNVAPDTDPANSDQIKDSSGAIIPLDTLFDLRYDRGCMTLAPSDARVEGINVIVPKSPGTFALKAIITQYKEDTCATEEGEYASKLAFITVG